MQNNEGSDELWEEVYQEECLEAVTSECDIAGRRLDKEKDQIVKTIWGYYLDSAEQITKLYKERQYNATEPGLSCWAPFQAAAGNVTKLYKESCEGIRRSNELAIAVGHQRRNKEITDYLRGKRRRYILRDDLLSFLSGKPMPPQSGSRPPYGDVRNTNHPHQPYHHPHHNHHSPSALSNRLSPKPAGVQAATGSHNGLSSGCGGGTDGGGSSNPGSDEMHIFKEALAVRSRAPELYTFVVGEIARHGKRPASPPDVNMDSPTLSSKRPRYYE